VFRTDIDQAAFLRQQELRHEADQNRLARVKRPVSKTTERPSRTIAPTPRYAA